MSRRQRVSRTGDTRSTHEKILKQAVNVINEDGFDMFNVQKVLELAGVSRATLYLHFSDVDDLIEAALVATYAQEIAVNRALLDDLIDKCPDKQSFRNALRDVIDLTSRIPAAVRLRRTHTIALCATRPTLAAAIAKEQDELTAACEHTVREAQRRGFARADLDARVFGEMMQAIPLGRIVGDAGSERISDERWAATYFDILDRAILTPDT